MHKTVLAGTAVLALSLLLTACSGTSDMPSKSMSDSSTSSEMTDDAAMGMARTGMFEGLGDKHVSGTVSVSDSEITLSGFASDEGPDLHLYLTNGSDEAAVDAGMEIDAVAFDQASQTFTIKGVDTTKYDTAVIHCDKAKAVFGAASLDAADAMQSASRMGDFSGLNEKQVSGSASITGDVVHLTGFASDEGPDLHLYLTNGTDEAAVAAGVELGTVAFDKAMQDFSLKGVDASGYSHVVVHCDKAKAVFGAATLS